MVSGDPAILEWLRLRLPLAEGVAPVRTYRLLPGDGTWTLDEDGVRLGDPDSGDRVVLRLLERLNQLACFTNPRLSVHSGLVSDELARGIWIPAVSGGGKTTLTAQLTMSGLRYGTDEVVVVRSDGQLSGWPKWLSVKKGSQGTLRSLAPDAHDPIRHAGRWMVPPTTAGLVSPQPVVPVVIAFPRHRHEAAATRVEQISRAAAVAEIASQAFNLGDHGIRGVDALGVAVRRARACVRISYHDGWDAAQALIALLRSLQADGDPAPSAVVPQSPPGHALREVHPARGRWLG